MKLIKAPTRAGCVPASLAMVLDLSYGEVIEMLGHDGLDKLWPEINEPNCFRGFAEWEIVETCLKLNYAAIPIVGAPAYFPPHHPELAKVIFNNEQIIERLDKFMMGKKGIIAGWLAADRKHACAWDGERVYDPQEPRIYTFEESNDSTIALETFYLIEPLQGGL